MSTTEATRKQLAKRVEAQEKRIARLDENHAKRTQHERDMLDWLRAKLAELPE